MGNVKKLQKEASTKIKRRHKPPPQQGNHRYPEAAADSIMETGMLLTEMIVKR